VILDNKLYYSEEKWEEDSTKVREEDYNNCLCKNSQFHSRHFEKLFSHKLFFVVVVGNIQDGSDRYLSETWFHGRLAGGRRTAEKLLREFCKGRDGKDGTFLVRESDTFIRNYIISLWYPAHPFIILMLF